MNGDITDPTSGEGPGLTDTEVRPQGNNCEISMGVSANDKRIGNTLTGHKDGGKGPSYGKAWRQNLEQGLALHLLRRHPGLAAAQLVGQFAVHRLVETLTALPVPTRGASEGAGHIL